MIADETLPLPLPGWSLNFDAIGRWLILTDPSGNAAIIAKDVDLEYGGDIAEHWRRAVLREGTLVDTLARELHEQQTFDAECFAAEFGAPNCPCEANIARLVHGGYSK